MCKCVGIEGKQSNCKWMFLMRTNDLMTTNDSFDSSYHFNIACTTFIYSHKDLYTAQRSSLPQTHKHTHTSSLSLSLSLWHTHGDKNYISKSKWEAIVWDPTALAFCFVYCFSVKVEKHKLLNIIVKVCVHGFYLSDLIIIIFKL